MFTLQQIQQTHNKVKSGADFPKYIQEIKTIGVLGFETRVVNSHTNHFGKNDFQIQSESMYENLTIAN